MIFLFHIPFPSIRSTGLNVAPIFVQAIDFLDKLIRFDHHDRLTAREAMVGSCQAIHSQA